MRSVRTIVLGATVAVCALGTLSAPAFASKEPVTFGKFVATATGSTKGHGEVSEMRLGPYRFTGKNLGNGMGFGPVCEKELKSKGEVMAGESNTFQQDVKFSKCYSTRKSGTSEEAVSFAFTLDMVFHSNGSAEAGGEGTEVEITKTSAVKVKGSKSSCELLIPAQTVPVKAATKPEDEYEAASYETEEEPTEGKGKIAKFGPIRKRLDIEMAFKKIKVFEQLNPAKGCTNEHLEEGATFNEETDQVEYHNGALEAELEEISLNDGNISFEPAL
jgi:hypothetical protein